MRALLRQNFVTSGDRPFFIGRVLSPSSISPKTKRIGREYLEYTYLREGSKIPFSFERGFEKEEKEAADGTTTRFIFSTNSHKICYKCKTLGISTTECRNCGIPLCIKCTIRCEVMRSAPFAMLEDLRRKPSIDKIFFIDLRKSQSPRLLLKGGRRRSALQKPFSGGGAVSPREGAKPNVCLSAKPLTDDSKENVSNGSSHSEKKSSPSFLSLTMWSSTALGIRTAYKQLGRCIVRNSINQLTEQQRQDEDVSSFLGGATTWLCTPRGTKVSKVDATSCFFASSSSSSPSASTELGEEFARADAATCAFIVMKNRRVASKLPKDCWDCCYECANFISHLPLKRHIEFV